MAAANYILRVENTWAMSQTAYYHIKQYVIHPWHPIYYEDCSLECSPTLLYYLPLIFPHPPLSKPIPEENSY